MAVNDFAYLIVGGSTKCGTTSLFEYLAAHPGINASIKKESRFFWTNEYPIGTSEVSYADGIEKYDSIFNTNKKSNLRLEATPDYLYSIKTAQLFKQHINSCKFVFILRNPIDRITSWYKFAKQLNLIDSSLSLDDYVVEQLNNSSENAPQHLRALEQGRYGFYLKNWYELFGSSKILVCLYGNLNQPLQMMNEICTFAELEKSFYNGYDFKIFNKSVNVKDAETFNKYRTFRRNLRRALKSIPLGKMIKSILKPVDKLYMNKTANEDWSELNLKDSTKNKLLDYYAADTILLEQLIQKKIIW